MKNNSFKILLLILFISFTGCHGYDVDGDKVYYKDWNEARGSWETYIDDADGATFKTLNHSDYGVDKNHAYYKGRVLKGSDPKSFIVLLDYYARDNKFAYQEDHLIKGANGKTFQVINGGPYSKDDKDYYFDTIALKVSDMRSFIIFPSKPDYINMAKDRYYYYINSEKSRLADYDTFIKLTHGYAKDKFKVYYQDSIVQGANPQTFSTIDYNWSKDNIMYYYVGKSIPIIDYNTFIILRGDYSKDKNRVYFYGKILKDADPVTFNYNLSTGIAKDKHTCYENGKKIDCNKADN